MLTIKKFSAENDFEYRKEQDMYKYLYENGFNYLFPDLLKSDDEKNILVTDRCMGDLKTFVELRRQDRNPDGPLTDLELLFVFEFLADAMSELWMNARIYLCNLKVENILLYNPVRGKGQYRLKFSNIGSIYC
jgi:hypothetical protein